MKQVTIDLESRPHHIGVCDECGVAVKHRKLAVSDYWNNRPMTLISASCRCAAPLLGEYVHVMRLGAGRPRRDINLHGWVVPTGGV